MDRLAPLRRMFADLGRWAEASGIWMPLLLVALIGPLGELSDVAAFAELEVELFASDLGLEAVGSVFLYAYHLVLMLLGAVALGRIAAEICGDGPATVRALVSRGSRRPIKVPIR